MKLFDENIYSNYPIADENVKVLTFNNLDFNDRKKLVPLNDILILFDESFLYIDGTSPDKKKKNIKVNKLASGVGKLFQVIYNFFVQIFEIWKFNLDFYIVITNTLLLIIFMKFILMF